MSPAIIAPPKPCQRGSERVIGIRPIIVVSDPNAIGSSLFDEASEIESIRFIFDFKLRFILSTKIIELLTTIPNRAKTPIKAGNESGIPKIAKIMNTPERANGITNITITAFLYDPN